MTQTLIPPCPGTPRPMEPSPRQTGIRQRSLRRHCRLGRATELVFVLVTGAVMTLGVGAQAQTVTWDGDTDGQWTTATNWSGDNVPDTATETAQIAARTTPFRPVITTAITVGATNLLDGDLSIDAGGTLNSTTMTISEPGLMRIRDGGTLNADTVTILGNINVNDGGILNGNVNVNDNGVLFVIDGTLTGDVNNTSTVPSSISFDLGSSSTMVGNLTTSADTRNESSTPGQGIQGDVTISGGRFLNRGVITGSTTVSGGTLEIQAGSDLSDSGTLTINGGTVNLSADETIDRFFLNGGTLRGTADATLTVTENAFLSRLGSGTLLAATGTTLTIDAITPNVGQFQLNVGSASDGGRVVLLNTVTASSFGNSSLVVSGGTLAFGTAVLADFLYGGLQQTVEIQTGGTVDMNGFDTRLQNLSGSGTVTNTGANAGLTVATTSARTFSGVIGDGAGAVSLTKEGLDTLTLSGANTYTGLTTVSEGRLEITGSIAGDVTVGDGTLRIGNSGAIGGTITTTGSVVSFANGVTEASPVVIGSNTTQLEVLGTDAATQSGLVSSLPGFGGFEKIGTGSLTLSGANTYEGVTNVSAGTLVVSNGAGLGASGAGNGTIVADGATLALSGVFPGGITTGEALTLNGAGVAGGGALRNLSGLNTVTGAITLGSATRINSDAGRVTLEGDITGTDTNLTLRGAGDIWIEGDIATGSGTLTKDGTGILILSGSNTFTGAVTVTAGALELRFGSALEDSVQVQVASGATLRVRSNETIGNLSGAGSVEVDDTLTLGDADDSVFSGVISDNLDPGNLVKQGTGTLTLSGANTYTGLTTISEGTLAITNGGALGTAAAGTTVADGATLALSGGITTGEPLTLNGAGVAGGGALRNLSGFNTVTGAITLGSASSIATVDGLLSLQGDITGTQNLTLDGAGGINGAGGISVSGNIGTGSGTLTKNGSGVVELRGTNTFTGAVTVNEGTLWLSGGSALADSVQVQVASGAMVLLFSDETIGNLSGGGTVELRGRSTLTLGDATDSTFSGVISSVLTGNLVKQGTGTLTLTGANTYTGTTTISAGTLQVGAGGTTGTLGSGAVTNNGQLTFNRSNVHTVANAISGTGSVTAAGTIQPLVLTGDNTYEGTTTINAGASLQVGSGGTTGTLGTGAITNNGLLTFFRSDALTVAGDISGSGNVRHSGGGVITLTGTNSYAGTTTISSGTLQIGDGGTAGTLGTGSVANSAALVFDRSNDLTVANAISGTGTLTMQGTGNLTLSGANTYTGLTTISAGTLSLAGGAAIADTGAVSVGAAGTLNLATSETIGSLAGTGAVTVGANRLTVNNSAFGNFAGVISGTGEFEKTGASGQELSGANTFTGRTIVSAGALFVTGSVASTAVDVAAELFVYGSSLDDAAAVTLTGSGALALFGDETIGSLGSTSAASLLSLRSHILTTGGNNASTTFAGRISGTGGLTKVGTGTLTLTGNGNTYSGTTTISAGTLQIGVGSNFGALGSGNVVNNAELAFNRADMFTFANVISGSGNVTQSGIGTLTLTGANTYAGTTTISAGTLRIGDGGTSGSLGSGGVINNSALVFDRSDDITVANVISGTGSLTKQGAGMLTLSGANTFTGLTTVSAGTLSLTGGAAIADTGAVSVALGATLRVDQSETVGALTNLGSVDLSAGNGTADTVLTVTGGYVAGSVLRVDTMLGDDSAQSDRVVIAGDTSGTTQVFINVLGGAGAQTTAGILIVDVAGASDGTFVLANGDTVLPGGETAITAPGGVFLYALRNSGGDWVLQSQIQPAAAAFEVYPAALLGLTQAGTLSQRLGQRQMLTRGAAKDDRVRLSTSGQAAAAQTGAWLSVSGTRMDVTPGASTGGLSYDQTTWSVEGGIDMVLFEGTGGTLVGGVSLFSGRGDVTSVSAIGGGNIDTDAQGIGVSATWYSFGGFYADLQLGYRDFDSDLSSATAGVLATGVGGTGRFVSVEIGQTFDVEPGLTLTPQAQLSWASVQMDGFVAPGPVAVAARDAESLRLRMGLAAERSWQTATGGAARLQAIGNLIHENSDTTVVFGTTPLEASAPDWSAELGLGGSLTWTDGARQTALYGQINATRGIAGGDLSGLSGSLGVRMTW